MGTLFSRLFKFLLKNPLHVILGLALCYFAVKVHFFGGNFFDKLLMAGTICLWVLWFMATHMLFLLLLTILISGGAYMYYAHTQNLKAECEKSGGYWNSNTRSCEEKIPLKEKIKKIWNDFTKKTDKKTENKS